MLETIGDQFRREVEFSSEIVKVHLESIKNNNRLALSTKEKFLPQDYFINSIYIYKKAPHLKLIDRLFKKNTPSLSIDEISQMTNSLDETGQIIFVNKDNLITVVSSVKKDQQAWILAYQYDSSTLSDFFKSSVGLNVALISKTGEIGKNEYSDLENISHEKVNTEFKVKANSILDQNSITTLINLDGESYLLSSVKLYQTQWYLSTFISEARVLENLQTLVIKSFFFFIFICSVVVLISYYSSHYLTQRLNRLTKSAKRISAGHFDEKLEVSGNDEISTLTSGFNHMTTEIVRLLNETANKARMESELKTAQIVQSTLLPKDEYESEFIQIKGCYTSASECGGDWWHYFESQDKVWIWIADATGHGAPAALLTSAAKSAVSVIERLNLPLQESFEYLNFAICSVSKENMMMTSFLGVIDKKTKVMTYINASHEPSIFIKKNETISKDDLIFLNETSNPRLGQMKEAQFSSAQIQLEKGDRVVFYTDGVMDVKNSDSSKSYGERNFMKDIVKSYNSSSNLNEFYVNYKNSLDSFRSNSELVDDVTYCFFEIKNN